MPPKSRQPSRSVTFRLPKTHYELLARLAEVRGQDVSGVLNALVADSVPAIARQLAERSAAVGLRVADALLAVLHLNLPPWAPPAVRTFVELARKLPPGPAREAQLRALAAGLAEGRPDRDPAVILAVGRLALAVEESIAPKEEDDSGQEA